MNPLLHPREIALLQMLADGKSRDDIAKITGQKRPAVSMRLRRIEAALNVKSVSQAIAVAIREGLIK